jgi:hypothetical protein
MLYKNTSQLTLKDVESKRLVELLEKGRAQQRGSGESGAMSAKMNGSGSSLLNTNGVDASDDYESDASVANTFNGAESVAAGSVVSKYPNRPSLRIHNNEDHNTTCGRIVAQGKFSKLMSVGYVQAAIEQQHEKEKEQEHHHHHQHGHLLNVPQMSGQHYKQQQVTVLPGVVERDESNPSDEVADEDDISDLEDEAEDHFQTNEDEAENHENSAQLEHRIESETEALVESMKAIGTEYVDDDEVSVALDKKIDKEASKMMKRFGIDVSSDVMPPGPAAAVKRAESTSESLVLDIKSPTGLQSVERHDPNDHESAHLVAEEDRETGDVDCATWVAYARASGVWLVTIVLCLFILGQVIYENKAQKKSLCVVTLFFVVCVLIFDFD